MISVSEVTLMTDASVDQSGNAGFGYWCVSNKRGGTAGGAKIGGYIKDSYQAECLGVINALIDCINKGLIQDHDNVLIQLDNLGVVRILGQTQVKIRFDLVEAVTIFKEIIAEHKLTVKLKHVKGHAVSNQARYKANNMCDIKANYYRKLKTNKGGKNVSKH